MQILFFFSRRRTEEEKESGTEKDGVEFPL